MLVTVCFGGGDSNEEEFFHSSQRWSFTVSNPSKRLFALKGNKLIALTIPTTLQGWSNRN